MSFPNIQTDRSERVQYDKMEFPVYIRKGRLSSWPEYRAESHWHDDIELILILSGQMQYNINGEVVLLRQGEGLFVNARQLHFGYSDAREECEFLCILLHPTLLCSSPVIEQNYVQPLLHEAGLPFYLLSGKEDWERKILSSMETMYAMGKDSLFGLKILREFLDIWIALWKNVMTGKKESTPKNYQLSALKDMISYIQNHYREKVMLEQIARAGKVGKTGCCNLFKKYTGKTPNGYLTELRLRKGAELLCHSDMTVQEISYEVGFSGASYFTETFRKYYGCTPGEYRKRQSLSYDFEG